MLQLLIVDTGVELLKIEVKTTSSITSEVNLRTSGGNQSWNKLVKTISIQDCDLVFCYNTNSGSHREFKSFELEGRTTVTIK